MDTEDLINSPFGGRYCGLIPPRDRTSLYRTVAFSFYSDKNTTTPNVFEGYYTFQNDCEFPVVNIKYGCSHNIGQHLGKNNNLNSINGATQRGRYAAECQKVKNKKHEFINSKKKYVKTSVCVGKRREELIPPWQNGISYTRKTRSAVSMLYTGLKLSTGRVVDILSPRITIVLYKVFK